MILAVAERGEYVASDNHAGLRAVWNASDLARAEAALTDLKRFKIKCVST